MIRMEIKKGTRIAHEVLEELDYILVEPFDGRDVKVSEGLFVAVDELEKLLISLAIQKVGNKLERVNLNHLDIIKELRK